LKRVVIAVDSFKGTMSSIEVGNIIEQGIKSIRRDIETVKIPIADGGEGTVDTFLTAVGGRKVWLKVQDPLFREIEAFYGILPDGKTAVIEMAAASGLSLVEGEENPRLTTTYGTGQLLKDALDKGCQRLIIGIGGSATNDGGIGMAAALGVKFLDEKGGLVSLNGQGLEALRQIDCSGRDQRLDRCEVLVACDVDNPLYGKNGAAYVFSPQKGADAETVEYLDRNLKNYAAVLMTDLGIDAQKIPGSGAAGGLGAGLTAFACGKLKSGIDIILEQVHFDQAVANADLIITGEGKIDGQSLRGKVPVGVAARAVRAGVPVIAVVGNIGDDIDSIYEKGIAAVFSINRAPLPFSESRLRCREDLQATVESLFRFLSALKW